MTTATTGAQTASAPRAGAGGLIRRLNVVTGIGLGLALAIAAYWICEEFLPEPETGNHKVDATTTITLVMWAVGFLIGVGAFIGPFRWLTGRDLSHEDEMFLAGKDQGVWRYFRFTTDHKVVGIQYLGGCHGALRRRRHDGHADPDQPGLAGLEAVGPHRVQHHVGLHGIIMIIATIIMVTGPFGNFILPIMIGARDMAFPRLNALSFWILFSAIPVLLVGLLPGRHPDRLVAPTPRCPTRRLPAWTRSW